MQLKSYLRLAKYAAKSRVLSLSPAVYWRARKLLKGHGEPELKLVPVLCRKDSTAVDIGAHFGMYSYWMREHSAEVHAFEPVPRLAKVLAAGHRRDGRVSVHEGALSATTGEATLRAPIAGLGRSTIEVSNALEGMKDPTVTIDERSVTTWTLDEFELQRVALIKIDVEGHEESALQGALATLAKWRPALIVELEERHNPGCIERVTQLLAPLGYERYQFDGRRLVPRVTPQRHNFLFLQPGHVEAIGRTLV